MQKKYSKRRIWARLIKGGWVGTFDLARHGLFTRIASKRIIVEHNDNASMVRRMRRV